MRRALGKGLSQLIGEQSDQNVTEASIDEIVPNQRQPRTYFKEEAIEELAASIKEVGILLVRPLAEGRYELIAGERRFRAAQLAGLKSVPIVVRAAGNQSSLEIALIENIQREDITPLESARAFRKLMDEFGLTQEQVADKVGKSRTAVANTVRLLRLPPRILQGLEIGEITEGHARSLLSLDDQAMQLAMYDRILSTGMTVRDVERAVKPADRPSKPRPRGGKSVVDATDPNWRALQQRASEVLGSPVKLEGTDRGGKILIDFYSEEDLIRIMDQLGVQL
jgi:ParB family transcriptional regulator, chromosome partitioning protein